MVEFITNHPYLFVICVIAVCMMISSVVRYITGYREMEHCPCNYCNT